MPTTTINSVLDLTTWLAGIPSDMGGATYRGEMNNTGEYILVSGLLFTGHTNGSIVLTAASGQSFRDNVNVRDNELRYDAANGVAITSSISAGATIQCDDNNVTFEGLQIRNTDTFGAKALYIGAVVSSGIVSNCILDSSLNTGVVHQLFGGGVIKNTLIIGRSNTSNPIVQTTVASNYYSCTIVNPSDLTVSDAALDGGGSGAPHTFFNCAFFGCSAVSQNYDSATVTFTTCMTDGAGQTGVVGGKTYGNQFIDTTNSSGDWREKPGADLKGAGTADSTNSAFDISNLARPQDGRWDIGAWELESESSGIVIVNRWNETISI